MSRDKGYFEYADGIECEKCSDLAVLDPGERFDALCVEHLNEAYAQDEADRRVKWVKENA